MRIKNKIINDYVISISRKIFCEECDCLYDESDTDDNICFNCLSDKRNSNIERILNNEG